VHGESALRRATTWSIATRLLDAGADPQELSGQARRDLLGYSREPHVTLVTASPDDFKQARTRRFGTTNPEHINEPFWESMIRAGISGYEALQLFDPDDPREEREPIWCAQRFGQSLTLLPDGHIVQIGGEHEDWYDPDFCIYNDVFVHGPGGALAIYGYPEEAFPPTDFHTATLVGDHIYLIGSLGYPGTRRFGETPVYRLDVRTFEVEPLAVSGDQPGWISRHRAILVPPREIHVSRGKVAILADGKETYVESSAAFVFDVELLQWRRAQEA
jgi:hypothetical protein